LEHPTTGGRIAQAIHLHVLEARVLEIGDFVPPRLDLVGTTSESSEAPRHLRPKPLFVARAPEPRRARRLRPSMRRSEPRQALRLRLFVSRLERPKIPEYETHSPDREQPPRQACGQPRTSSAHARERLVSSSALEDLAETREHGVKP